MDTLSHVRLKAQLMRHEGAKKNAAGRHIAYVDTVGKTTIGFGRNISDVGLSTAEAGMLLSNDIDEREQALTAALPWFAALDDIRQRVLIDMAFMGVPKLLLFARMLAAAAAKDYATAAKEMLDSTWARQVGARATELAAMMRDGMETA